MIAAIQWLFERVARHISFAFGLTFFALVGAYFGAAYAFFFISSNFADWSLDKYSIEAITFAVAVVVASLGHGIQFGLLHRLGLSGLLKPVVEVNSFYKHRLSTEGYSLEKWQSLLKNLLRLPAHNSLTAFFWALLILVVCMMATLFNEWSFYNYMILLAGWLVAATTYTGFNYVITDFLAAPLRSEIKQKLLEQGGESEWAAPLSLRAKFFFLLLIVSVSLAILAINNLLGKMNLLNTVIFISITILAVAILLYLYFQSITSSLEQIKEAAVSLAAGNRGSLPLMASERELVDFSRNFRIATDEVYEIRQNLQSLVDQKTHELQKSLQDVQALKEMQDGDYFLTSILLDELKQNTVKQAEVDVDFLIEQKKKFSFRKWSRDLGGDICIAHEITLDNKRYVTFLNADAMGKSMQGAGGALVLGSAFHSIIERTRLAGDNLNLSAERWLKNSFTELHKLFESFDGSMLISLVFGLINVETGLLYYFNAEHPWLVLVRDGTVDFIKHEQPLKKLGTPGVSEKIFVEMLQLRAGDQLIIGSDGRDDIELGQNEEGRVINHDENLFLTLVKEAAADLQQIRRGIKERGSLSDDLSLIKITYNKPEQTSISAEALKLYNQARARFKLGNAEQTIALLEKALQHDEDIMVINRELFRLYYRQRKFEKAAYYLQKALRNNMRDIDMLYYGSLCYKRLKAYGRALMLADQIRLRNPGIIKNMVNLADIYLLMGEMAKAEKFIKRIVEYDPGNAKIERLQKALKKYRNLPTQE